MPSPDKLFRLDPVETKIAAPTTNFQVLAEAADQSVANRSLGRGLTAFSQALGGLAQFKKQQQIRNDIKTAKDAAVRGEVMPDVLPVAETAYQNVIDKNTASESLLAIERFENGDDFDTLIKSETPSDQKTSQIEASYDDFYARAAQSMQNPNLIQNLRITVNGLKEKAYQKVYERERDLRTIEGIHGLKNTLGETKRFAEATGVPLIDALTPNWVQANAKDLGKSHPYLSPPERKLLAFQTLTTDIDVLADPQIIEEIMKSNFNKGFTFRNLYEYKATDRTDADKDRLKEAKEFQEIYNAYVQNSKDYFTKLDQDATASNKANVAQFKDTIRQEFIETGQTSANGISKRALDSGFFDEAQANKLQKDIQKYMDTNIKFQEGSPEDIAMVDFILAQGVTLETQVDALVLAGSLNPALATKYKNYLKEENKQKLAFIGKYKEQVKDIAKNALSLSKLALGNKMRDILGGVDRDVTPAEMMRAMLGTGLPTDQVNNIIGQIQDFHNGLNAEAEKMGLQDSVADRADGAIPPEHLQKFQLRVENQVNKLIVAIDKGLESRPDTRKANLPSLEFPVIPTSDEFPLVVNQTKNIFDKSGFALKTGPDISPTVDSGIATFDIETSFLQAQNMTLRSYVLDATTKNWPKPLSDVVIAEILQERKDKEQKQKDKEAEPDTPLKQAKRKKQETLDNIENWFSDLGENIGLIPGFLKDVFTPGLDVKTGKMAVPYADLSPEEQKEVIQRKHDELDNIEKTVIDSGKNLLNLMKSIVGVSEAEGATTSQDADFDPKSKEPQVVGKGLWEPIDYKRYFDAENQPTDVIPQEVWNRLPKHSLSAGDTLSDLANQYNISVEELQRLNPQTVGRETALQIGEQIALPSMQQPQQKVEDMDFGKKSTVPVLDEEYLRQTESGEGFPKREEDANLEQYESFLKTREATRTEAVANVGSGVDPDGAGYGHTLNEKEKKWWETASKEQREAQADKWFKEDVGKARSAAQKQMKPLGDRADSDTLESTLTSINFQLGTEWRTKFPKAWKGIAAGQNKGTTPMFKDKTGWDQALYHLMHANEKSNKPSKWLMQTPRRVLDAVLAIHTISGAGNKEDIIAHIDNILEGLE